MSASACIQVSSHVCFAWLSCVVVVSFVSELFILLLALAVMNFFVIHVVLSATSPVVGMRTERLSLQQPAPFSLELFASSPLFGVNPYASSSSLYDDSESKVITDQANDALMNAGVEADLEKPQRLRKKELDKTFSQAMKEQKAEKIIAKQNWEASKSKSSKKSSSSSKSSSKSHKSSSTQHL
jgi:hypothetical protein